jgi:protein transport protein HofC
MLQTADRTGNLPKVLPACRRLLQDAVSQVCGALNYVLVLAVVGSPALIFVPMVLKSLVLPKFVEVFAGMLPNEAMPAFTRWVFGRSAWTLPLQAGLCGLMWLAVLGYMAGPRAARWVGWLAPGLPDRLVCWLPWRRKRLQRDFSAMLALLLDADMPEAEAVTVAADATANRVIQRRAAKVCRRLSEGVALPEAVRAMDDTGELHWRLSNARRSQGGFLRALAGWHEALDAKAFQLEQCAAQVLSTLLVLLSGAVVGSIIIAIFLVLVHLTERAVSF